MATEIERLAVLVEANTASYSKAMQKLQTDTARAINASTKSIGKLDSSFASLSATVGGFARGFLGAFSVGALTTFVGATIKGAAAVGDMADELGITAEQLQSLSYIADQAGTSQETLATGFKAMAKALGEAQRGSKGAADEFKALGLSVEELQRLDPADAFVRLLDAIGKIQNPLQRNAELMKVFGRSGAELGQMAQLGAAGMAALQERARALGIVLSNETIKRFQDADDELGTLSQTFNAVASTIVAELLPGMIALAQRTEEFFSVISANIDTLSKYANLLLAVAEAASNPVAAAGRIAAMVNAPAGPVTMGGQLPEASAILKNFNLNKGGGGPSLAFPDPETEKANADRLERLHRQMTDAISADQQRIIDNLDEIRDASRQALGTFVDDLLAGKSAAEGLSDVLKQIGQRLLSSGLDSLLSGLLGSPGSANPGLLGSVFGGGRAAGGPVSPGKSFLVGEKGPELFSPRTPGVITPGGGGNGGITIYAPVDARGATNDVIKQLPQILDQNNKFLLGEILRMRHDARYRPTLSKGGSGGTRDAAIR